MIELLIFSSIASGILGGYIAKEKNRSLAEGAIIGFLFSLIGVLVVALLPTNDEPKTKIVLPLLLNQYQIIRVHKGITLI